MSDPNLPDLPPNQRWAIDREFCFLIVRLQERRWWGWRTIASSIGLISGGRPELMRCIDHIVRREYYGRLRDERDEDRRQRAAEIPLGTFRGRRA